MLLIKRMLFLILIYLNKLTKQHYKANKSIGKKFKNGQSNRHYSQVAQLLMDGLCRYLVNFIKGPTCVCS